MNPPKRERAINFNYAEVQLLTNLVLQHQTVIENKKTDAVTNKDKEEAWKKVETSFNASGISPSFRTWKTLKLKYEGIKKTTKKKASFQRQEMYKTGGGPSNAPDFNEVEEKVLSICSNIKGLEARHDSDTIIVPVVGDDTSETTNATSAKTKIPDMNENFIFETDQDITFGQVNDDNTSIIEIQNTQYKEDDFQKEDKWNRWHPNALKSRVSQVLKPETVTKSGISCKLDKLSEARLELVQLQLKFAKEELNLKMTHLANDERRKEELHNLTIEKFKAELARKYN